MGRKRKANKRARRPKDAADDSAEDSAKVQKARTDTWSTHDKPRLPNERFQTYYRRQPVVPPEEFEAFMEALASPLPLSFRITGHGVFASDLRTMLQSDYFAEMAELGVALSSPPRPIPWYPDDLAWKVGDLHRSMYSDTKQVDFDRKTAKKHPLLRQFKEFLVEETAVGGISRQEEVSMIPALLLDVKPDQYVLDMCAAPGSKTAQILEAIHADEGSMGGLVVANDTDRTRCYMLYHQIKRLQSPSVMVTSYSGQDFPSLFHVSGGVRERVQFDRVLADVPCSGDGTMRKNIDLLWKWGVGSAIGIHRMQLAIGLRGAQLLKPGGRMVYSTCSLNPVEDEAVVAAIIKGSPHELSILDVSDTLPGLVRSNGVATWSVSDKHGTWFESPSDAPQGTVLRTTPTLFPPPPEEAAELHLERCMRILPHQQNTGGFFVAVIEKLADGEPSGVGDDAEEEKKREEDEEKRKKQARDAAMGQRRKNAYEGRSEAVFRVAFPSDGDTPPLLASHRDAIIDIFGILPTFPWHLMLYRTDEGQGDTEPDMRKLYIASEPVVKLMAAEALGQATTRHNPLIVVNMGLRMFEAHTGIGSVKTWRATQEGLNRLLPHITRRTVMLEPSDLARCLLSTEGGIRVYDMSEAAQARLRGFGQGCVIVVCDPKDAKPEDYESLTEKERPPDVVEQPAVDAPDAAPLDPKTLTGKVRSALYRRRRHTQELIVVGWLGRVTLRLMAGADTLRKLSRAIGLKK